MRLIIVFFLQFNLILPVFAQTGIIRGKVLHQGHPVELVNVGIPKLGLGVATNSKGEFEIRNLAAGNYEIIATQIGYEAATKQIRLADDNSTATISFHMTEAATSLDEVVVVSGTLKEMSKLESPVNIEVYTPTFFKKNPVPSLFESMQNINGVRPQLNCNVCNTGDIHINGLEGPYTMILIDGMPIVSGLSTVYGLSGIPAALIERVEIVKGPASTLYGSEAVGGLVNVITRKPETADKITADAFATSWAEFNTDIGFRFDLGEQVRSLMGINYYNYSTPIDNNNDGFTDVTLQNRISLFNKISINRKNSRVFTVAGRYVYEDRWGGDMNWTPAFRGGDSLYAESIYTKRWEILGNYQLPLKEKVMFQFSVNGHDQNSVYGTTFYLANQKIGFSQLTWNTAHGAHDVVTGVALRYTWYDDNTPATYDNHGDRNSPSGIWLPGVFIQDEIRLNARNKVLLGIRYDHNSIHGNIFTPRLNYKWNSENKNDVLRFSIGNGYRVANVFTEDHAALTGARNVIFLEALKPETSWNTNLNYTKLITTNYGFMNVDATAFYTYFDNKIIPDYTTNENEIIYRNLDGHAVSRGISVNLDMSFSNGLKVIAGGTMMEVYSVNQHGVRVRQMLTENFTAVWSVSYPIKKIGVTVDYTGNLYGPMKLPVLGELDPRQKESPWWSIQNIQLTKALGSTLEVYGGVKNLLNFTPPPNSIARSHDPFDKNVVFDGNGKPVPTTENPYAMTFDPSYVFAPNQGMRFFLGLRYQLSR